VQSWEKFSGNIEKSRIYHQRYHRAVSNPIRRKILELIACGKNLDDIKNELGLKSEELEYHLRVLESGFCIRRDGDEVFITKEGEVVERFKED